MTMFLVPVKRGRFELYSEAPEEAVQPLPPDAGRLKRWAHAANAQWHSLVESARHGGATGRMAQWRDQVVCRMADTMAEQRTLSSLRNETTGIVRFPSNIDEGEARTVLNASLAAARRHHGWWLTIDLLLFIASGVLFFVPGPNIVAYYVAFRVVGHLNSWRGAKQGAQGIEWTFEPDTNLAELGALLEVPGATRGPLVEAIAARLNLPRLTAFFERVTA